MMDGWFQSHATLTSSAGAEALAWMGDGKKSVPAAECDRYFVLLNLMIIQFSFLWIGQNFVGLLYVRIYR